MTYASVPELDDWIAAHKDERSGTYVRTPRPRTNYTERAHQRIAAGRHPLMYPGGLLQLVGTHTCGDCGHLTARELSNRYLKCELNQSASAATDVRRWWPACTAWTAT